MTPMGIFCGCTIAANSDIAMVWWERIYYFVQSHIKRSLLETQLIRRCEICCGKEAEQSGIEIIKP